MSVSDPKAWTHAHLAAALANWLCNTGINDFCVRGRTHTSACDNCVQATRNTSAHFDLTLAANLALAAAIMDWRREHPKATFMPWFVVQTAAKEAERE